MDFKIKPCKGFSLNYLIRACLLLLINNIKR
jgi:hypothetical protein